MNSPEKSSGSSLGRVYTAPKPDFGHIYILWTRYNTNAVVTLQCDLTALGIATTWPSSRWPAAINSTLSVPRVLPVCQRHPALHPLGTVATRAINLNAAHMLAAKQCQFSPTLPLARSTITLPTCLLADQCQFSPTTQNVNRNATT